jgi:hypothetical protein
MNNSPPVRLPSGLKRMMARRPATAFIRVHVLALVLGSSLAVAPAWAAREVFQTPNNGSNLGVWRITHDPSVRDWANYHNTQCWSPDGRYLCSSRYAPRDGRYGDESVEVHLHDLERDESRLIERGFFPRWARHRNWLFYVRIVPGRGAARQNAVEVRWLDLETGRHTTLAAGVENLGETSLDDRWIYGAKRFRGQTPEFVTVRIPLQPGAVPEELPGAAGAQLLPNPRHPVFFTRQDHKSEAFGATRWFYDLDGGNKRMAVPTVQQCHMSWLGNGEYLLMGNGLVRGRRWNEPYPSNVDVLASVTVGDISPCGRSGRFVCGDSVVADLRSGDGWHFIHPLSMISYPARAGDQSGNYDADPKGSPDGTKICFVSNYDLKDAPLTYIDGAQNAQDGALHVKSTQGFPPSGRLSVRAEVIGYQRKTATRFEGLTRTVFETRPSALADGLPVTSFDARLMTAEQWQQVPGAPQGMRRAMPEDSPLLRQRQTDVYVAVVRRPDRPHLWLGGGGVQLIPGEEHAETRGYHVLCDGQRITTGLLQPGSTLELARPGEYGAVAVEWSGLESEPGLPVRVAAATRLFALAEPPPDFSWTQDRWLVGTQASTEAEARKAATAIREILHLHDGIIHRESYQRGALTQRHDLNARGEAVRRLTHEQGRLVRREYFQPGGGLVSRELLDADGFVMESIRYRPAADQPVESDHWWFERGVPLRRVSGNDEYFKQGDQWISKATGKSWARE